MIDRLKQTKAGFTLVELIVVIAILAILASVAIPVYSGYIGKANEASDLQLLGALNTAYAAACAEMGLDPTKVVGLATLSGETGSKTVSSVTASGSGAVALSAGGESFYSVFQRYYGDNINTPFRVYESLGYDMANGVFVDGAKEISISYNGNTISISYADLTAYSASTFGQIPVEELTGMVATLSDRVIESSVYWLENNEDFKTYWDALGIDTTGWTADEINAAKANALVLWAAQASNKVNTNALLTGEGSAISSYMADDELIAASAMEMALMTAYAKSSGAMLNVKTQDGETKSFNTKDYDDLTEEEALAAAKLAYGENATITVNSPHTASIIGKYRVTYTTEDIYESISASTYLSDNLNNLSGLSGGENSVDSLYQTFIASEGYQNFLENHGASDLAGYIAAMNMINANVDSLGDEGLANALKNGFGDDDLQTMIAAILGSGNP